MKKILISLGVIVIILAAIIIPKYNNFVVMDETVKLAWSQVENQYQRRADLVPQLVAVVGQYASHEKETLESVINARSAALSVTVDINNADELKAFYEKQSGLTQALSKLMLLQEQYPNLKAAPLFSDLNVQLEGTENRIATERGRYNEEIKIYNSTLRQFPNNFISSMFGISTKPVFESNNGSEIVPDVKELFQ